MNCAVCQAELQPHHRGAPKRYCSRQCSNQARNQRDKAKRSETKTCAKCGVSFTKSAKNRNYCSKQCSLIANKENSAQRVAMRFSEIYPNGIKTKICRWCNESMQVSAKKSYAGRLYHEDCSKEAQSARYRIKTVKRQKKTTPHRISHDQVVREYGSDCHICKEPIDLDLPRTHRFGLTVDHVIPVNKGGTDDMTNLRPAHWICNIKKSDKMPESDNA